MKRVVHKFATGEPIPVGAKYLNTVTQTNIFVPEAQISYRNDKGEEEHSKMPGYWERCWLVWHYYEVEVAGS
jgi:hypothetical protein